MFDPDQYWPPEDRLYLWIALRSKPVFNPMQHGALRALEFDRIVDAVRRLAQTPPGGERLTRLHPLDDAREVTSALATTGEAARFLSGTGEIALRAPAELDAIVDALAVEGRAL